MSIAMAFGEPMQVIRAQWTVDGHRNRVPSGWHDHILVERCGIGPVSTDELTELGRQGRSADLTVYMLGEHDITADDRVSFRGETYEVVGDPKVWRSPLSGYKPGQTINVKQIRG